MSRRKPHFRRKGRNHGPVGHWWDNLNLNRDQTRQDGGPTADVDLHGLRWQEGNDALTRAFQLAKTQERHRIVVCFGRGTGQMRDLVFRESPWICRRVFGKGTECQVAILQGQLHWAEITLAERKAA